MDGQRVWDELGKKPKEERATSGAFPRQAAKPPQVPRSEPGAQS